MAKSTLKATDYASLEASDEALAAAQSVLDGMKPITITEVTFYPTAFGTGTYGWQAKIDTGVKNAKGNDVVCVPTFTHPLATPAEGNFEVKDGKTVWHSKPSDFHVAMNKIAMARRDENAIAATTPDKAIKAMENWTPAQLAEMASALAAKLQATPAATA